MSPSKKKSSHSRTSIICEYKFDLTKAISLPDEKTYKSLYLLSALQATSATQEKALFPNAVLRLGILHSPRTVNLVAQDVVSEPKDRNSFSSVVIKVLIHQTRVCVDHQIFKTEKFIFYEDMIMMEPSGFLIVNL